MAELLQNISTQAVGASPAKGDSVDMDGSEAVRSNMQVVPQPEAVQQQASSDTGDAVVDLLLTFFAKKPKSIVTSFDCLHRSSDRCALRVGRRAGEVWQQAGKGCPCEETTVNKAEYPCDKLSTLCSFHNDFKVVCVTADSSKACICAAGLPLFHGGGVLWGIFHSQAKKICLRPAAHSSNCCGHRQCICLQPCFDDRCGPLAV